MFLKGDCIEVMKAMKPNSMDAIVTDPPYNLHFMGKDWDKDLLHEKWLIEAYQVLKPGGSMLVMGGTRTSHRLACAIEDSGFIIKDTLMWIYGSGFPKAQDLGKMIDKRMGKEGKFIKENPNARPNSQPNYSLNGKSRNFSINVSPITEPESDLAKHWNGFKVGGIKPAYEPIIWAVKPPEGSYIDNVLKHGVGAVNVDECRIVGSPWKFKHTDKTSRQAGIMGKVTGVRKGEVESHSKGRFPANIILSHHPECVQVGVKKVKGIKGGCTEFGGMFGNKGKVTSSQKDHADIDGLETVESWDCHPDCAVRLLDEQSGMRQSKWGKDSPDKLSGNINYVGKNRASQQQFRGDSGGSSRFFKQCNYGQEEWLCHEGCALRQLDEQSGILKSGANPERRNSAKTKTCYGEFEGQKNCISYRGQNSGGASRFLYCAKASRGERNVGLEELPDKLHGQSGGATQALKEGKSEYLQKDHIDLNKIKIVKNNHPTIKPIKLFEWLIKLITREDQIILDPFIGSGTTAIAAHNTGRKCVGIEKEEEYLEIAKRRATHWRSQPRQLEMI